MSCRLYLSILSLWSLVEVHSQQTFPFVSFMGQTLTNHSYVDLSLVEQPELGGASVQCHTDLSTCCTGIQGDHRGDWYFPDGTTRLPFIGDPGDIYENRLAQRVDLGRRNSATSPTGLYRCDIPTNAVHDDTDTSVRDTVYVGLYTTSGGMTHFIITYYCDQYVTPNDKTIYIYILSQEVCKREKKIQCVFFANSPGLT